MFDIKSSIQNIINDFIELGLIFFFIVIVFYVKTTSVLTSVNSACHTL